MLGSGEKEASGAQEKVPPAWQLSGRGWQGNDKRLRPLPVSHLPPKLALGQVIAGVNSISLFPNHPHPMMIFCKGGRFLAQWWAAGGPG